VRSEARPGAKREAAAGGGRNGAPSAKRRPPPPSDMIFSHCPFLLFTVTSFATVVEPVTQTLLFQYPADGIFRRQVRDAKALQMLTQGFCAAGFRVVIQIKPFQLDDGFQFFPR
jgi:hypothetical protein